MAEIRELWDMTKELVGEEELTRKFRMWMSTLIRQARRKLSNIDSGALFDQDIAAILADLNERAKSRFSATDTAKSLIIHLLKQGYTPVDFFRVHEAKCNQWLGNEKMEYCIRPSTLYRPSHFDEYLAEWWRAERQKQEFEEKRKKAQSGVKSRPRVTESQVQDTEREALICELMSKPWYAHDTWVDFMRWTVRFPDAESLGKYLMPKRIREMRKEPGMMMAVAKKQVPAKYEAEYTMIKEEVQHG